MKKLKKKLGKVLVVLLSCLTVCAVVNAEGSATTEVQIGIEATDDMKEAVETVKTVQTGDKTTIVKYLAMLSIAAVIVIGYIWKKKKGSVAVLVLFLSVFLVNGSVQAAVTEENINVTIPTSISISFDETGENSISEFGVSNQSLVPITIEKINVTECNEWNLAKKGHEIPVNTKEIVFEIEGKCLVTGENIVSIPVVENTSETMNINVERGAWTKASAQETALKLEFEYAIGRKEFNLSFDTNGCDETIATQKVYNGDSVTLPSLEREGYVLAGWEDSEGNLYTNQFVMPIGDVVLKANWKEEIAYAIYSASDTSLRFVRTADSIEPGNTYNGRVVTDVFTGFEEDVYASEHEVPWYDGNYYKDRVVTQVVFEDTIKPKSTAYWFCWTYDCTNMDMRKLDMSDVTDMSYMCGWAGAEADTFTITGINDWDVSNVTNMDYAFRSFAFHTPTLVLNLSEWNVSKVASMEFTFMSMGYYATNFSLGDLSKWDVLNVTNMQGMFMQTGYTAPWSLNLSDWNVSNVRYYTSFNTAVESKIVSPNWK